MDQREYTYIFTLFFSLFSLFPFQYQNALLQRGMEVSEIT